MTANIVKTSGGYSLDEIATGETWIDGKPIYRKVYSFDELPLGGRIAVGTITDLDFCVRLYGVAYKESNHNFRPLPFAGTKVQNGQTVCNDIRLCIVTNNTIEVETFDPDWANYAGYVIAEYTKV